MSLPFKLAWAMFCLCAAISFEPLLAVGLILVGIALDEIIRRFGGER